MTQMVSPRLYMKLEVFAAIHEGRSIRECKRKSSTLTKNSQFDVNCIPPCIRDSADCRGARAYCMRYIAHKYSHKDLINIPSHVAAVIAPASKLLIADSVIPDRRNVATLMAGIMDGLMFYIGESVISSCDIYDRHTTRSVICDLRFAV